MNVEIRSAETGTGKGKRKEDTEIGTGIEIEIAEEIKTGIENPEGGSDEVEMKRMMETTPMETAVEAPHLRGAIGKRGHTQEAGADLAVAIEAQVQVLM